MLILHSEPAILNCMDTAEGIQNADVTIGSEMTWNRKLRPGGTREISRRRQPPDTHTKRILAPAGRRGPPRKRETAHSITGLIFNYLQNTSIYGNMGQTSEAAAPEPSGYRQWASQYQPFLKNTPTGSTCRKPSPPQLRSLWDRGGQTGAPSGSWILTELQHSNSPASPIRPLTPPTIPAASLASTASRRDIRVHSSAPNARVSAFRLVSLFRGSHLRSPLHFLAVRTKKS